MEVYYGIESVVMVDDREERVIIPHVWHHEKIAPMRWVISSEESTCCYILCDGM
jgi:hypothetical protein